MRFLAFSVFAALIIMFSCSDNEQVSSVHAPTLPSIAYNYMELSEFAEQLQLPEELNVTGLPETIFTEEIFNGHRNVFETVDNDDVATLGRVLFYDNRMSKNNSISCASCHQQKLAFSDNQKLSQGFGGKMTSRNSMALVNSMMNDDFFWDGRTRNLRNLALAPVFNHIEMGIEDFSELKAKLEAEEYYPALFRKAFGSSTIDEDRVSEAIGQFVASLLTADSKFDKGITNDFADYTELEKHGMALFFSSQTNCSSCHSGVNFAASTVRTFDNPYTETSGTTNIGLDVVYDDPGFSQGKFKIPSLRNIALTGPYMHDGRFETLRDVLDHYNENVQAHKELDVKLNNGGTPRRLNLTDLDLDALEAFLNTLTGEKILTDERYSNPFS